MSAIAERNDASAFKQSSDVNIAPQQTQANPPGIACAECGRLFSASDVILLNNLWVCGGCKPLFLHQLREGVIPVDTLSDLWRVKHLLVTRKDTPFPDRCVRCNAPANGYRHRFRFHIVTFLGIKTAEVHVGLCEKHQRRISWSGVVGSIGIFGGLGAVANGVWMSNGVVCVVGLIAFIFGVIWAAAVGVGVSPTRIRKDKVWLTGVNKDFLARLPEWKEP